MESLGKPCDSTAFLKAHLVNLISKDINQFSSKVSTSQSITRCMHSYQFQTSLAPPSLICTKDLQADSEYLGDTKADQCLCLAQRHLKLLFKIPALPKFLSGDTSTMYVR